MQTSGGNRDQVVSSLKASRSSRGTDFLLVLPTYNEAENIASLIRRIVKAVRTPLEIVVVDDGSPDGTAGIVEGLKGEVPGLYILRRSGKMGLGSAYLAGFSLAEEAGFPYVITMDCDHSHDPAVINDMVARIPGNDLVIGSRYCPGGDIPNFELWRRVISKGGNLLAKTLLGIRAMDCTSGFRCYRTKALQEVRVHEQVRSRRYIFLVELLSLMTLYHCRIAETPIIFNQRTLGKTKVTFKEMFHALEMMFALAIRQRISGRRIP